MFHQTVLSLACFALLPVVHAADYEVDPTFRGAGWGRLYEVGMGTQDEKTVAFARTADSGYVVALEVAGGAANGGNGKSIGLARLDRNGNFVTSGFGTNGRVFKDAYLTSVTDMTIDAQGRIIVVGATPGQAGLSDFGVVRFNANGSDDTSFGGYGATTFGFDNAVTDVDDKPTSVATDPDGRIVVAGNYRLGMSNDFSAVRFNTNGSIDSTFGIIDNGAGGLRGTYAAFQADSAAYASRILRIVDGYYLVVGTSVLSATDTNFAARILTPKGQIIEPYSGSEIFPIDEPGPGGSLFDGANDAILVDPTTVLLVGTASGKFAATRITVSATPGHHTYSNLTTDLTFVGSAIPGRPNRYVGNILNAACESAALSSDGRMLMVGGTSSTSVVGRSLDSVYEPTENILTYVGVVTRLNPDGSPDSGFTGGSHTYVAPTIATLPSAYTGFKRVLFDGGQPVIVGSSVDSASSVSDFDGVITRLKSDLIFTNNFE